MLGRRFDAESQAHRRLSEGSLQDLDVRPRPRRLGRGEEAYDLHTRDSRQPARELRDRRRLRSGTLYDAGETRRFVLFPSKSPLYRAEADRAR